MCTAVRIRPLCGASNAHSGYCALAAQRLPSILAKAFDLAGGEQMSQRVAAIIQKRYLNDLYQNDSCSHRFQRAYAKAILYGAELATKFGASLHLLHTVDTTPVLYGEGVRFHSRVPRKSLRSRPSRWMRSKSKLQIRSRWYEVLVKELRLSRSCVTPKTTTSM